MKMLLLLPLLAAICGCSSAFDQIFLRPVGDPLYANSYYPELPFPLPSQNTPRAAGLIAARGRKVEGHSVLYEITVKITILNPSSNSIIIHRDQQAIRFGGYEENQTARELLCDGTARELMVIPPSAEKEVYLVFAIEKAVVATPAPFTCTINYTMCGRTWPLQVEFIEILPGEVRPHSPWANSLTPVF